MGCCASTPHSSSYQNDWDAGENSARSGSSSAIFSGRDQHSLLLRGGEAGPGKRKLKPTRRNNPLRRRSVVWTAEQPITMNQLRAMREAFWETAPSYEGRIEIWQALRLACECEDLALAQAIVDSANVAIPTGELVDGCYDELGNRYVIPHYCFSPPTNLVALGSAEQGVNTGGGEDANTIAGADDDKHAGTNCKAARSPSSPSPSIRSGETTTAPMATSKDSVSPTPERALTVRLSTGTDLKLRVPADDTVASLRRRVLDAVREKEKQKGGGMAAVGWRGAGGGGGKGAGAERNVKFFFLGRVLDDKVRLRDLNLPDPGGIVQASLPVS